MPAGSSSRHAGLPPANLAKKPAYLNRTRQPRQAPSAAARQAALAAGDLAWAAPSPHSQVTRITATSSSPATGSHQK